MIHSHPTYQEGGAWDAPTAQADQDALNAVLMSEFPQDALALEPADDQVYRWDFRLVRTLDALRLRCRFKRNSPVILHGALTPKPWQSAGIANDTYFQFLRRLLTGPDLVLRVPTEMLTPEITSGVRAWATRRRHFLANMSLLEFGLSVLPSQLGIPAKRGKDWLKQVRQDRSRTA